MTKEEISECTGIDTNGNSDLWAALVDNPKLNFDEGKNVFQYKPEYNIKSKEDLLAILREHTSMGGIDVRELVKSWVDVIPAILVKWHCQI